MGSDWWMFDRFVKETVERKCKEFKKNYGIPNKVYISGNLYAAKDIVKKLFPNIIIIETNDNNCTGFDNEFKFEK
jgi:hypothetical protein